MISLLFAAVVAAAPAADPPPVAGVTVERQMTKAEIRAEKRRIARDPNRLICKKVTPTGSSLPVEQCRTQGQLQAEREEFERDRDQFMRRQDPQGMLGRR